MVRSADDAGMGRPEKKKEISANKTHAVKRHSFYPRPRHDSVTLEPAETDSLTLSVLRVVSDEQKERRDDYACSREAGVRRDRKMSSKRSFLISSSDPLYTC